MNVRSNYFVIVSYNVIIFLVLTQNEINGNVPASVCIDNINSTCLNLGITKWNKNNVGESLKHWIESIQNFPIKNVGTQIQYEQKKVIKRHPRSNILTFVGKIKCSTKKFVGPVWKIGGLASRRQFHNGFLYGELNEKEMLTGVKNRILST